MGREKPKMRPNQEKAKKCKEGKREGISPPGKSGTMERHSEKGSLKCDKQ